jgi:hypothetical protein
MIIVYCESIKRELKIKPIYECQCDERLKTETETMVYNCDSRVFIMNREENCDSRVFIMNREGSTTKETRNVDGLWFIMNQETENSRQDHNLLFIMNQENENKDKTYE